MSLDRPTEDARPRRARTGRVGVRVADQVATRRIAVGGSLEGPLVEELRSRLRASAEVPLVLLDLTCCEGAGIAAVTVMVSWHRHLEAEGRHLRAFGACGQVLGMLELLAPKIEGLLFPTESAALIGLAS
ncbi:MAG: hypothetical protein JST53_02100 [Actinobacteria bacterium]|nr:hypothetical protein [Actinomycetota bacterium]